MTVLRMDAPNEKQRRFLLDRHRHIAYGGARGGGKSWAVRTKAKLLALRYAGIKLLIVRRTLRELQNNHIDPLRQELAGIAKYKASDKRFEFPNGSVVDLRLLRVQRRYGAVPGRRIRRGVSRRGRAAAKGVDRRDQRLRARDERASEADVLHAEPRRAGAWVF